ncbi:hypothetical protein DEO48_08430 [Enterobacter sp. CGMCC 5087]|uniref:DUF4406 domain-containing protein n=1 Tax=Enterobacter sp. CGMCC 5087 TaxID=2183878 RepID=UPI000D6769A4|nr:DUF4406 domain-containing protein [Enterobacter sp. CGMCC 5087]PWI80510.1 hypothetical protein DEO48_08430 [Enterobacter sp. CGMCC 5087]
MIIYISGPMAGLPDFNRPAFFRAAEGIAARGHQVLNPAALPEGLTPYRYMDIHQAMLRSADAIFLLNGRENSPRVLAELHQARKLGLLIIFQKAGA